MSAINCIRQGLSRLLSPRQELRCFGQSTICQMLHLMQHIRVDSKSSRFRAFMVVREYIPKITQRFATSTHITSETFRPLVTARHHQLPQTSCKVQEQQTNLRLPNSTYNWIHLMAYSSTQSAYTLKISMKENLKRHSKSSSCAMIITQRHSQRTSMRTSYTRKSSSILRLQHSHSPQISHRPERNTALFWLMTSSGRQIMRLQT